MGKILSGEQFLEIYREIFDKEADKSKYGLVAAFGNFDFRKNILSDVDIYFSPQKNIHPSDFYKEHHRFNSVAKEIILKDYNSDIITFPTIDYRPEVVTISKRSIDEVLLHNLVFMNKQDVFDKSKKITNDVFNEENMIVFNGDPNQFSKFTNPEFLFYFYSFVAKDTLLSNYPINVNSLKVIDQVNYVKKNLAGVKPDNLRNMSKIDAEKLMYEGLDIIKEYFPTDKLAA